MRPLAHVGFALVGLLPCVPRLVAVVLPLATSTGCACPANGAGVVIDPDVVPLEPRISVRGEACDPASVACIERDRANRCTTFWIEPKAGGSCVFVADLADGSRIERTIELEVDDTYPCRGNIRPQRDGVIRINKP